MQPVHGPTGPDCTDVLAGQVARRALIRRIFIKCLFTLYGGRHWLNQNLRSGHLELNQETIVAITKKQRHVHTRRWQSRANSVRHRVVPLHRATGAFAVLRTSNIDSAIGRTARAADLPRSGKVSNTAMPVVG